MILFKKMVRDMLSSRAQFIAILLMSILGVLVFSGLDSLHTGLKNDSESLYLATNMADMWVYATSFSDAQLSSITSLAGVDDQCLRMSVPMTVNDKTITFFSSQQNTISTPYLLSGIPFDNATNGVWLDSSFAKINNYKLGETLPINGQNLLIKGLIISGELIYSPTANGSAPNHAKYGYAYVSKSTMTSLFGAMHYNQLLLKINSTKNISAIETQLPSILGASYLTSVDRAHQPSAMEVSDKIAQFQKFAFVFPAIFFSLALLTMLTTMTRMIESQRVQIGTLMSLGYSRRQIIMHYISYGLWMGLLGGVIGLIIGRNFIPAMLKPLLTSLFVMQRWSTPVTLGSIVSVILIVVCCMLAVYCSCQSKLSSLPATILHGSKQKSGRRTLLEGFRHWHKLPSEYKFTLRSISRNKIRSAMGVVGVLGCMMLILAGLGMHDTLRYNLDNLYSGSYNYIVVLSDPTATAATVDLPAPTQLVETGAMELSLSNVKYDVNYTVQDTGNLAVNTDNLNKKIAPASTGITISSKLASLLNVHTGQSIAMRIYGGDTIPVTVTDTVSTTTPQQVYFSKSAWLALNQKFLPTAILSVRLNTSIAALEQKSAVDHVVQKTQQISDMNTIFKSANMVVYILITAAIMLGATILYNLGTLALSELSREYATLKVLGFYPSEIRMIAFRENLLLTIIGYAIGVPAGIWFLAGYMGILSSPLVTFYTHINTFSFVIASLITLICSIGVNLLLSRKIAKIDMVTSLKSAE